MKSHHQTDVVLGGFLAQNLDESRRRGLEGDGALDARQFGGVTENPPDVAQLIVIVVLLVVRVQRGRAAKTLRALKGAISKNSPRYFFRFQKIGRKFFRAGVTCQQTEGGVT